MPRASLRFGTRFATLLHGSAIEVAVAQGSQQPSRMQAPDTYPVLPQRPDPRELAVASAEAERLGALLAKLRAEQGATWTQAQEERIQWLEQARAKAAELEAQLLEAELEGRLVVSFEEADAGLERARALLGQSDERSNPPATDGSPAHTP